jgi:cation:H+ antiporter
MEHYLLDFVLLAGGFVLLAKGADWLVGGSSRIARMWGVRALIVGLTVVAWGTSAPEVVVSTLAAVEGKPGIAMGNVLGSNIANIGLVLGACALVLPRVMESAPQVREAFWLMASLGVLWWTVTDLEVDRTDGVLLLLAFLAYNVQLYLTARQGVKEDEPHEGDTRHPWRDVIIGCISVAAGAKLVVMGAESIAHSFGVSDRVIGLTVVAVGTSLPELAAGLGAAIKGESEVSLGNVIGSNVFNVLAVIGIAALVAPFEGNMPGLADELRHARDKDFLVVAGFHFAALLVPRLGGARFGRWKGLAFLLAWAWYAWQSF